MQKIIASILALSVLAGCAGTAPGAGALGTRYEVHGVEEGDFLKLRGGPGTGFETYVGLPNGTVLRLQDCTQTGGTRWCRVALDRAPGLEGFVSWAYLREI